jgi:hypothetical protein
MVVARWIDDTFVINAYLFQSTYESHHQQLVCNSHRYDETIVATLTLLSEDSATTFTEMRNGDIFIVLHPSSTPLLPFPTPPHNFCFLQ